MPRCTTFDLLTQDCTSSPSNLTLTEAPGKKCGHLGTWTVSTWSFLPLWKLQRLFQLIWLFKRWSDCVFFVSFFLNIFYSGSLWSCSCLHSFTSSQSSHHWIKSWVKAYTNHHLSLWALVGLINIKKKVLSPPNILHDTIFKTSTVYEMLFKYVFIWFLACQRLGASPVALRDTEPYLLVIFTFILTLLMPADTYSSGNLKPAVVCVWRRKKKVYKHRRKHSWHLKYDLDLYMSHL